MRLQQLENQHKDLEERHLQANTELATIKEKLRNKEAQCESLELRESRLEQSVQLKSDQIQELQEEHSTTKSQVTYLQGRNQVIYERREEREAHIESVKEMNLYLQKALETAQERL